MREGTKGPGNPRQNVRPTRQREHMTTMPDPGPRTRPDFTLRRAAPVLAIAAGALLGAWLLRDLIGFETLSRNRAALIAWRDDNLIAAGLAYIGLYILVVAVSLPGAAVLTLAGGFLFGLLPGTALTVTGATIGATAIFLAARHGFGDALHARIAERGAKGGAGTMARFERGLRENAASFLLLMRLVPAVPFFVANLAPAFFGIGTRLYVLTTFFGILPGTFVYTWIGTGLGEVFARGESPDLSLLTDPVVLGPLLGLAALAALPIVLKPILARWGVR